MYANSIVGEKITKPEVEHFLDHIIVQNKGLNKVYTFKEYAESTNNVMKRNSEAIKASIVNLPILNT